MKAGNGQHFEQCFNAQAAVEVDSRLIVGDRVSQAPNDKQELVPTVAAIPAEAGKVGAVLTDNGFYSEKAVQQIEQTARDAAEHIRSRIPGAALTLLDAAHISNIEQAAEFTAEVLGFVGHPRR